MYERFTDRARRVIILAQEVARLKDLPEIDDLCLLYGLRCDDEGVAAITLKTLGHPSP
jgi:hypothetical protein